MSIFGGMVDEHHPMELEPSTRLIRSNWFARHMWAILAVAIATAVLFIA